MCNKKKLRNSKIIKKLELQEDIELKGLVLELIEENDKLNKLCKIDPLTGVYNRRIMNKVTNHNVVVLCDIDDFKSINDTYGHLTGDNVIKSVARIIMDNIETKDYVCRIGGDEFAIFFKNCSEEDVRFKMKKILKIINDKVTIPNSNVTLCVGIATSSNNPLEATLKEADKALYKSKSMGKNKVIIYNKNNCLNNI